MKIYVKIWIKHNGPIPKDWEDRSYEIHHIDGNDTNNDITNLRCVTIREHYYIHWFQGDWGACQMLAIRMKKTHQEISELAALAQKKNVENGTHHFLGGEQQRKSNKKRIENGTHHFLGGKIQKQRVNNGTHNLSGPNNNKTKLENGTHHCLITHICPYCKETGKGAIMFRWHFDNCKLQFKKNLL